MDNLKARELVELTLGERQYLIRLATGKDHEQIASNVNKVIAEGSLLAVKQFTLTEDWRTCFMANKQKRHLLVVAVYQGQVVGHCRLFPVNECPHIKYVGEIGFLVLSEHQNSGLGSILSSYVLDQARELAYRKVILYTASENKPALRLASKLSFIEVDRRVRHYYLQNKYMDEVQMARFIN